MSDRYWIYHCIDIARDAGSIDAARDAVGEIEQLKTERDAAVAALEMIAGVRPCLDNLMSDKDIARAAIDAARGKE